MKERPILFSGEMVRAILTGQKTQTRRVCKIQPELVNGLWQLTAPAGKPFKPEGGQVCSVLRTNIESDIATHLGSLPCPYGVPGDRLWVRECFGFTAQWPLSYQRQWLAERGPWLPGNITMAYRADDPEGNWCWKPSIHMPKIYSRIMLEIVNVRVERVQDISEEDVRAEGISSILAFSSLWNTLNQARGLGWNQNPWCWCISFRRYLDGNKAMP